MKIAFFDTKPYDKEWFDKYNDGKYEIVYFEGKLNRHTVGITAGFDAVCGFVNDDINENVINRLVENKVGILAMRSAGYSNVDLKAAKGRLPVVRVPFYSPYAVAEHAMGLLLTVNRKLARAVTRTRDFNFSIIGLMGVDLYGKTVGVIGTGTIGKVFINICKGFGMNVIAYDPYPDKSSDINYVPLEELFSKSDIISLHCPLTDRTQNIMNAEAFAKINLNRVQAFVDSRNINAAKSLIGIGFNYEGELSEYEYFDGQYINIKVFALTKKRFLELYGE